MKLTPIAMLVLMGLTAACTIQPPQSLQQKLEGKTPEERKDFLYSECRKEAKYRSKFRHTADSDHFHGEPELESPRTRLRKICNEMKKQMDGEE